MDGNKSRRDLKRILDIKATNGLRVVRAQKDLGSIVCSFIVPDQLSDKDGNGQVGAIAMLIDSIGDRGELLCDRDLPCHCQSQLLLPFNRQDEEVEIGVKVLGPRGMVEIRKKEDGKLIALANQWLGSVKTNVIQLSKS